jgi:hypothetical protein
VTVALQFVGPRRPESIVRLSQSLAVMDFAAFSAAAVSLLSYKGEKIAALLSFIELGL